MKKVTISVFNDLHTDQRVQKTIQVLLKNGYTTHVIGLDLNQGKPKISNIHVDLLADIFKKGFLRYALFNFQLFFKLLFTKTTIYWANDLDSLIPNFIVAKLKRKKLIYDSHELFSELPEIQNKPFVKKVWQIIEWFFVPKIKQKITVSQSYANWYKRTYNTNFKVVRNLPVLNKPKSTINVSKYLQKIPKNKKIILYQGALNQGRGIDTLIESMKNIDAILVLVGTGDLHKQFLKLHVQLNLENKIVFLGRLSPIELKEITPLADVGVSIEQKICLSYYFALPNKMFDYIHAGVPMVVSDFPEMKNIVTTYQLGEIIENHTPEEIAFKLNKVLENGKECYSKHLEIAKKELTWENEQQQIISLLNE